jgi:hypothetical protein
VVVEPWLMSIVGAFKVMETTRIYIRTDRIFLLGVEHLGRFANFVRLARSQFALECILHVRTRQS